MKSPRKGLQILVVSLFFLWLGCSDDASLSQVGPVVDFVLVAAPADAKLFGDSRKTDVLAYNGTVPGPEIHVQVGQTIKLKLYNQLSEPTTIHWHGMELPARMDGSSLSQSPVLPGESFTYEFKVQRAGTYWYHPHFNASEQVERGLYGALIVHDPKDVEIFGSNILDKTYVLDDLSLDENQQITLELPQEPLERARVLANGREGHRILVNGRHLPREKIEIGRPIRMRFINAANSRFFRLSWGKSQQELYRIGGDLGLINKPKALTPVAMVYDDERSVFYSDPDLKQSFSLVPGERGEVYWVPQGQVGATLTLEWHDQTRGRHFFKKRTDSSKLDIIADAGDGRGPSVPMIIFELVAPTSKVNQPEFKVQPDRVLAESPSLNISHLTSPEPIQFKYGHDLPLADGSIRFFAQAIMEHGRMKGLSWKDLQGDYADQVPKVHLGEVRIIEIFNFTRAIHPFHLHGFPFIPLEVKYFEKGQLVSSVPLNLNEWKDTVPVPARTGYRRSSWSVLRVLVSFEAKGAAAEWVAHGGAPLSDRSGGWLAHCHILEHAQAGMASWINVLAPKEIN